MSCNVLWCPEPTDAAADGAGGAAASAAATVATTVKTVVKTSKAPRTCRVLGGGSRSDADVHWGPGDTASH